MSLSGFSLSELLWRRGFFLGTPMSLPEPEAEPLRLRDVRTERGVPDLERERGVPDLERERLRERVCDRVLDLEVRLPLRLRLRLLLFELARWSSICRFGELERDSALPLCLLWVLWGVPLRER